MIDSINVEIDELKKQAAKIKIESANIQNKIREKKTRLKALREEKRRGRMSKSLRSNLEALECN